MHHDNGRIPTLDGWRGIAVLLVILFHFQMYLCPRFLLSYPAAWFGSHGVAIFFLISGYLITTSLLNRGDLKRFYLRRFLRLVPAAWVYLATLCLLSITTHKVSIGPDLLGCLFFFRNYIDAGFAGAYTTHFWSLSLEEQFYLIWPVLLIALGKRWAGALAAVAALAVAIHRASPDYMRRGESAFYTLKFFKTEIRVDAILVGCLLGLVMSNPRVRQWITDRSGAIFWCCLPLVAFDFWRYQAVPPLHENIALALMIACTMTNRSLLASRLLEMPHLKTTGVLCYGIYLWQGLFLRAAFAPFGIVLLPIAVFASWTLIEQPSLRLADKILRMRNRVDREEESTPLAA